MLWASRSSRRKRITARIIFPIPNDGGLGSAAGAGFEPFSISELPFHRPDTAREAGVRLQACRRPSTLVRFQNSRLFPSCRVLLMDKAHSIRMIDAEQRGRAALLAMIIRLFCFHVLAFSAGARFKSGSPQTGTLRPRFFHRRSGGPDRLAGLVLRRCFLLISRLTICRDWESIVLEIRLCKSSAANVLLRSASALRYAPDAEPSSRIRHRSRFLTLRRPCPRLKAVPI